MRIDYVAQIYQSLAAFSRGKFGKKSLSSLALTFCLFALLFSACGGSNTSTTASENPPQQRVNGFGTAQNHVHSFLSFPSNVLVLATHYGLFRSTNG